jgi:hypothetical protein
MDVRNQQKSAEFREIEGGGEWGGAPTALLAREQKGLIE